MVVGGRERMRAAVGAVVAAAFLTGVIVGPASAAPESCSYNAGTKAVTATDRLGWPGDAGRGRRRALLRRDAVGVRRGNDDQHELHLDRRRARLERDPHARRTGWRLRPGLHSRVERPRDRDRDRSRRRDRPDHRLRDRGERHDGAGPARHGAQHRRRRRRHVLARDLPARGAHARRERLLQRPRPGRRRTALPRADHAVRRRRERLAPAGQLGS